MRMHDAGWIGNNSFILEFFQHVLVNTWVGGIQLEEVKQSFCNSHNGGVLQLIVQSMIPSSLCGSVRVCVVRAVRAVRASA